MDQSNEQLEQAINHLCQKCHQASVDGGWWHDLQTGEKLDRNKAEMLALIHSEISEALEGERKRLQDGKLPQWKAVETELADALIRIFDYAGGFGYDVGGALFAKLDYNKKRSDHKIENRIKEGGKSF